MSVLAAVRGGHRHHQVVQILVKAFHRELERVAELLLDADAVVDGAGAADARGAERFDALVGLRRLMIEPDSALERRARKAGVDVVASAETGIDGPAFGVRVVVRAYPGIELEPCHRRELEHGVRGRAKYVGFALQLDAWSTEQWPRALRGVEVVGRRFPGHLVVRVLQSMPATAVTAGASCTRTSDRTSSELDVRSKPISPIETC